MSTRLTGQDTTIRIFKDGELQAELGLFKSFKFSYEMAVSREDYLGQKRQRPDGKFDIEKLEGEQHMELGAYLDFYNNLARRARREPGSPISIDVTTTYVFPNGDQRTLIFKRLEFETIEVDSSERKGMVGVSWTAYADDMEYID